MKYRPRPGQQLRPHGGHHYFAHGIKFEGETHTEVVDKVSDYRLNNTIPIGNVEQEVLAYYADKFPWMVDAMEESDPAPKNDYYAKWRAWIQRQWKNPLNRSITPKEAALRWAICERCPHNIKLAVDSSPEGSEMLRRAFLLRRGANISKKLGFCSLHQFDIGVASFLEAPASVSGKLKDTANYEGCWVEPSSLTEHR